MITLEMVRKGLEENLITLTDEEYGTACRIGSGCFYFGGTETDNVSPEEYLAFLEECGGDLAEEIFDQLENMRCESGYEDEYTGYERYLKDNLYKVGDRKLYVIVCGTSDGDPHRRCAHVKTFLPGENINIFKPEEEALYFCGSPEEAQAQAERMNAEFERKYEAHLMSDFRKTDM